MNHQITPQPYGVILIAIKSYAQIHILHSIIEFSDKSNSKTLICTKKCLLGKFCSKRKQGKFARIHSL